jgi:exodeoxyribonuclease-3
LKVVSANVNGIRAALRRDGLTWLAETGADVLCLQEVRATHEQLHAALADTPLADWHVSHSPAAALGRSGVAILTRIPHVAERIGLGPSAAEFDDQGRWLEVDVPSGDGVVTVASVYVHTGEAETERQDEKHRFLDAMTARLRELRAAEDAGGSAGAVVCGDVNVAHREDDIKNWKGNRGKAGFLESERAYLDRWFDELGWVDVVRAHHPDGPGPYTWWSWRGKAFDNDAGWRIDYQLATPALAATATAVEIGRAATYAERWSDHAAVSATYGV